MLVALLRKKVVLVLLAALVAAALLVWIPMVGRYSLDDPAPVPAQAAIINEDPRAFLGRRVQVAGEVQRVYGPRAFALEQDTSAGGDLLVIGRKPWTLLQRNPQVNELVRNDRVQVVGRVRRFKLSELQEERGVHPSDSLLSRWEGKPSVLAQAIELTPGVPDLLPGGPVNPRQSGIGGSGESVGDTVPDAAVPAPGDSASGPP